MVHQKGTHQGQVDPQEEPEKLEGTPLRDQVTEKPEKGLEFLEQTLQTDPANVTKETLETLEKLEDTE